jgi:hypothetical protein
MLIRLGFCVVVFGWGLFSYLNKQQELAQIKVQLPELEKRLHVIQEENRRMLCEIEELENPSRLIDLVHRPEFGHLKHPLLREILTVPEAILTCD